MVTSAAVRSWAVSTALRSLELYQTALRAVGGRASRRVSTASSPAGSSLHFQAGRLGSATGWPGGRGGGGQPALNQKSAHRDRAFVSTPHRAAQQDGRSEPSVLEQPPPRTGTLCGAQRERLSGRCGAQPRSEVDRSARPEILGLLSWAEAEVVEQGSGLVKVRSQPLRRVVVAAKANGPPSLLSPPLGDPGP